MLLSGKEEISENEIRETYLKNIQNLANTIQNYNLLDLAKDDILFFHSALKSYIELPWFRVEFLIHQSIGASKICRWLRAIYIYFELYLLQSE